MTDVADLGDLPNDSWLHSARFLLKMENTGNTLPAKTSRYLNNQATCKCDSWKNELAKNDSGRLNHLTKFMSLLKTLNKTSC